MLATSEVSQQSHSIDYQGEVLSKCLFYEGGSKLKTFICMEKYSRSERSSGG
jgi:hypothetical protein